MVSATRNGRRYPKCLVAAALVITMCGCAGHDGGDGGQGGGQGGGGEATPPPATTDATGWVLRSTSGTATDLTECTADHDGGFAFSSDGDLLDKDKKPIGTFHADAQIKAGEAVTAVDGQVKLHLKDNDQSLTLALQQEDGSTGHAVCLPDLGLATVRAAYTGDMQGAMLVTVAGPPQNLELVGKFGPDPAP